MRTAYQLCLAAGVAAILTGCAAGGRSVEEPLPRTQYQKVNVASYSGAVTQPGESPASARGTRYQSGSISSAGADWSRWPAGTLFRVLATGALYEVDDFTDDVVGTNTILLYRPAASGLAGDQTHFVTIEVLRWGSPRESAILLQQQRSSTAKRILADLQARYPQR